MARRITLALSGVTLALMAAVVASTPQMTSSYPNPSPGPTIGLEKHLATQQFMEQVWKETKGTKEICETLEEVPQYATGRFFQWALDNGYNPDADTIDSFIQAKCNVPV